TDPHRSLFLSIFILSYVLLSSISLLTPFLNLLVIISISHFKQLHTPTNILTLSLAVSDFFVGLLMLFLVMYLDGCWYLVEQHSSYHSCFGECIIFINYIVGFVDLSISFIAPITVIVFLYMRVFVVAVSQARTMRSHTAAVTLQSSVKVIAKKSELKAARTLSIVVVVFLICLCPYYCVGLTGPDNMMNASSAIFVIGLYHFNACVNPVIYALFYPWFRKSVKFIVTLKILQPGSCETNML
uniref:trace amine-associated receptor 13c-like n=1 Tax=Monopterus albus TaxID=43700 RepID=UPI0009B3D9E8